MARTTETLRISAIADIPTAEAIKKIPREKKLRLVFEDTVKEQRETVGQALKNDLDGFWVGVHMIEPEINVAKLITEQEVERHQDFFEACARDYRNLATELIFVLAQQLNVRIEENYPLLTFNPFKAGRKHKGVMGEWRYFFHGYHCAFDNPKTGQCIEVPLVFGLEFGDLDPYFFTRFIKSTKAYRPLPVELYEDYHDGVRVNQKMLALGKFERIEAAMPNHFGIAVTGREKIDVESFQTSNKAKPKRRFGFAELLKRLPKS
ncbi:DUF6896 domain-containing protein [Leminorella grimontii]|uniref:DUF6896 domain-containing protein n=1 Tax=Leminorella grimontii TaxID=82981 RepID=UPI00321F8A5C